MSFQNFLKLAQQNQAHNDNKVKKISEELRRNREQFIKERKAIEEANKRRRSMPPFISQNRRECAEYASFESFTETSLKTDAPPESGGQSSVEYIPTPISRKKPSSLMNALEELIEGSPASSCTKKRRIEAKIPKLAHLNPSKSLDGQKEREISRNSHKCASSDDLAMASRVRSSAVASKQLISLNGHIRSNVQIDRTNPKAVVLAQKPRDNGTQKKTSKHKPPHSSVSPFVNTNHSSNPDSLNANYSLIHPVTPSKGSMHSKRTLMAPIQCKLINSLKPVHSVSAPSKSHLLDLKAARPASQPPSSISGSGSRPLGIAAQLGLARSRAETSLLSQSPAKTSNNFINPISKAIPPSNGKSSLRPVGLSTNGQRKPPARMESSVQQPRPQSQMAVERSRAILPALRGIAAQYGSLPVAVSGRSSNSYLDDDSDEYASDDSFIDDTDCTSAKDYLRAVKDIHKSLHFDPNKYAKISKYDDLSSMESSYRQIEKEEKLSMRLGAREDQEDMAMEAERRRRRMAKR